MSSHGTKHEHCETDSDVDSEADSSPSEKCSSKRKRKKIDYDSKLKKKQKRHSSSPESRKKSHKRTKKKKKKLKKEKKQYEPAPAEVHGPSTVQTSVQTRNFAPMTREEYEKQQSVVRREIDPDTGRRRLVKGDGEILEEIVTKERHRSINKLATQGDGQAFQSGIKRLYH